MMCQVKEEKKKKKRREGWREGGERRKMMLETGISKRRFAELQEAVLLDGFTWNQTKTFFYPEAFVVTFLPWFLVPVNFLFSFYTGLVCFKSIKMSAKNCFKQCIARHSFLLLLDLQDVIVAIPLTLVCTLMPSPIAAAFFQRLFHHCVDIFVDKPYSHAMEREADRVGHSVV